MGSTDVLLSVRPEFVEAIGQGTKRYEFRKRNFARKDIDRVFIYATSPVRKVVGYIRIEKVIEGSPHDLWAESNGCAGIEYDALMHYFGDCIYGFAFKIGERNFFESPKDLQEFRPGSNPPQSFSYLN